MQKVQQKTFLAAGLGHWSKKDEPVIELRSKEENRRRERRFYGAVSEVRATLLGSAVADDVTFSA